MSKQSACESCFLRGLFQGLLLDYMNAGRAKKEKKKEAFPLPQTNYHWLDLVCPNLLLTLTKPKQQPVTLLPASVYYMYIPVYRYCVPEKGRLPGTAANAWCNHRTQLAAMLLQP